MDLGRGGRFPCNERGKRHWGSLQHVPRNSLGPALSKDGSTHAPISFATGYEAVGPTIQNYPRFAPNIGLITRRWHALWWLPLGSFKHGT